MARALRIEFPGAWYHVMNRGLGRRRIFHSDQHRQIFFDLIQEISQIFSIEIHAYSLMENHYHLLVRTPQGGLGRAMRHLNGIYTQKWNKTLRTDGPLFRGRYKAILVESEEYLTELVRYIHLNPVKAGLCIYSQDHVWTSHRAYLNPGKRAPWLKTEEILRRFGSSEKSAVREMNQFVLAGVPEAFEKDLKKERVILGSEGFKEWVYKNVLDRKRQYQKDVPLKDQFYKIRGTPRQILDLVADAYDIRINDIRKSSQGKENQARGMAAYLLRRYAGLPLKAIASWMNCPSEYTVATIQKRFRKKLTRERRLQKLSKELGASILNHVKT